MRDRAHQIADRAEARAKQDDRPDQRQPADGTLSEAEASQLSAGQEQAYRRGR